MKAKRNGFLTFLFSLLPGAGQMFMGFMKNGVSFMAAFTLVIFLAVWLDISELLFILPLLWFYSFFDCINKRYSSDEEFAALEDYYLFSMDKLLAKGRQLAGMRKPLAGILVLFLGVYMIINNLFSRVHMFGMISDQAYIIADSIVNMAPKLFLGVLIITTGIRLIVGKKREREFNA